jgi:DNA repair exonuclease SbcCD nuclease subunit
MRVLLVADTHLGFDETRRPRVQRRRRGADFFECFEQALRPALDGEADLVVHGGDLLYRARVPAELVCRAMRPLFDVADAGVPVVLVPGNHERSRIPFPLLAQHPRVHIFHRPGTFALRVHGVRVAVAGFPFARRVGHGALAELLDRTGWRDHLAELRLLCMHQAVEGARVGIHEYAFRPGPEVIERGAIPPGFAAVLSGHLHRAQILRRGLAAPVIYPGSVERTSFVEREETKGYYLLRFEAGVNGGRLREARFVPLPARPMRVLAVKGPAIERRVREGLDACEPDAVVRVDLGGEPSGRINAARLRALAPPTMNVSLAWRNGRDSRRP